MARFLSYVVALGVLVFGCAASPQARAPSDKTRPPVDKAAMQEAVKSAESSSENYSSSASYSHFLKARLLHHEGEHRQALDELRLALVTDEGNPYLLVSLAEEYARIGDLDRAERTCRRVIDSHPNYAAAHLLMGRVLGEQKKVSRARVHLKRGIKLKPDDPDGYLALAQIEMEAGRPDEAMNAMEQMSRAITDDSRGFRLLGSIFAERGDVPRAEKMLRRAVEVFPGDYEAWARLAQIFENTDRAAEAEQAYAEALARDPDNVDLLLSAGRTSLKIGADARAAAWFDRILTLTDDAETAVRIAFAYLSADRLKAAADLLDKARGRSTASEPRLSFYAALMHEKLRDYARAADAYGAVPEASDLYQEARLRRASVLSLAGHHARALDAFRKLSGDKPDLVALYPAWARAMERSGALKDAEKLLRGVLAKWPVPELYEALSNNLQRQGRAGDAVTLLEAALKERPTDDSVRFLLAAAYEKQGKLDQSIARMRELLAENPNNPAALNFIGYVLADHGRDFDEAERLVKRALELKPDSGAFLDSLGWVYFRRGETEKALELLEKAAALEPEEPVIIEHLGDAYAKAARPGDAARMYRRALETLATGDEPVDARSLRQTLERKLKALSTESAGR